MGVLTISICVGLLALSCVVQLGETCPTQCQCQDDMAGLYVSCEVHSAAVLARIPANVTHLLLTSYQKSGVALLSIDFSRFRSLEVLILQTRPSRGRMAIKVDAHSFAFNTRLRVLVCESYSMRIEKDALAPLANLEHLSISYTQMKVSELRDLIKTSLFDKMKLRTLSLRHMIGKHAHCGDMCDFDPEYFFSPLVNLSIEELDISDNGITLVKPTFSRVFSKLKKLSLGWNTIMKDVAQPPYTQLLLEFIALKNLQVVDFANQGQTGLKINFLQPSDLVNFQRPLVHNKNLEISPSRTSRLQLLHHELMSHSNHVPISNCIMNMQLPLGRIQEIYASKLRRDLPFRLSQLTTDKMEMVCFEEENDLHVFDLSFNEQWEFDFSKYVLVGLHNLQMLNLQGNGLRRFATTFFSYMVNLRIVLLGKNRLGDTLTSKGQDVLYLKQNKRLQVLDLANNALKSLPYNLLEDNIELQELNISGNHLLQPEWNLSSMYHLSMANLSSNRISVLSERMRTQLESIVEVQIEEGNSILTLDLSDNPLSCGCSHIDFMKWIQTTRVHVHNKDLLSCVHPYLGFVSITGMDIEELRSLCFHSNTKVIVLSSLTSCFGTLLCMLLVIAYRKRWKIRYWHYVLMKGWKRYQESRDTTHYEYDVFVAYNWQDGDWVHGPLLDELEGKLQLKLCIHHRDFLPGHVLEEVIVEKIEKSRKTLLVLSPNFVNSYWCDFEFHMARSRLFQEGNDVIVAVILAPLPARSVTRSLYSLLKRRLYLEWTDDLAGQRLFWRKLRDALACDRRPFESGEEDGAATDQEHEEELTETCLLQE